MIVKTSVLINDYEREEIEVEIENDDIAQLIANEYGLDLERLKLLAFDFDLVNYSVVQEYYKDTIEDYAKKKYYKEKESDFYE